MDQVPIEGMKFNDPATSLFLGVLDVAMQILEEKGVQISGFGDGNGEKLT